MQLTNAQNRPKLQYKIVGCDINSSCHTPTRAPDACNKPHRVSHAARLPTYQLFIHIIAHVAATKCHQLIYNGYDC